MEKTTMILFDFVWAAVQFGALAVLVVLSVAFGVALAVAPIFAVYYAFMWITRPRSQASNDEEGR
jgi:hypothetical protein